MTNRRATKARSGRRPSGERGRGGRWGASSVGVMISVAVFGLAIAALAFNARGGEKPAASTGSSEAPLKVTGGVNSMGFPFVETPGSATGTATAGPVDVVGANWTLGHVPLEVAVLPAWTLTNTGDRPVTLGEPRADVRKGCCPGPFHLDTNTLQPGESTELTFELAMHPGMDGWHDIGVYVPVSGAGNDTLELGVTGDFSA